MSNRLFIIKFRYVPTEYSHVPGYLIHDEEQSYWGPDKETVIDKFKFDCGKHRENYKIISVTENIRDLAAKGNEKLTCPKCGSRYETRSGLNIQCSCGYIIATKEG